MACKKEPLDLETLRLLVDDLDVENQMFTDNQYLAMYAQFDNIYRLAAHIWMLKATRLQTQSGGIKSYSTGDEKYDMSTLGDVYRYYMSMRDQMLDMAEKYEEECEDGDKYDGGSLILSIRRPKIL